MNLSELIIQYRTEHSMSQREFSARCGVSNGYMSMLENGGNPNTGKPLVPQIPTLMKIAAGMGMTLDDLLTLADDMPVDISKPANNAPALPDELSEAKRELIEIIKQMPDERVKAVLAILKG